LGPLKRLALSARVVSSEPHPQPLSAKSALPRAEEEPSVITETRAPIAPPPPVPSTTVEEGEAATEATVAQVALEALTEAGLSVEGVVVVLDEDSALPPPSESRDVAMAPASEPSQVSATACLLPVVEVPVPSPKVEVPVPSPTVLP
jgi:hypothetical protein